MTPAPETEHPGAVEQHGYDLIPEAERYLTPRKLGSFWAGINSYQFFFVLGSQAVGLGLSLVQGLIAVLVGNLLFGLVAYASLAGPRAGLPALTFTRAPFGILGNRFNAGVTWLMSLGFKVVNGLLGVFAVLSFFDRIGWQHSGAPGKIAATVIVLGTAIVIAVTGHRLLVQVQPVFAVLVTVVFLLLLCYTVGDVDWGWTPSGGTAGGWHSVAMVLTAAALIASGSLSYLVTAPDYARYLPSGVRTRSVISAVTAGGGGMALLLGFIGVLLATRTDLSDPVAGVAPLVPNWLFLLYIVACFAGAISNNASVFYSSGLAVQAVGVPLRRWIATAVDAALALLVVLFVLFVYDFEAALNDFLTLLAIWAGPFAGVWIADAALRHFRYDAEQIHTTGPRSRYWGTHGVNIRGMVALVAGMAVAVLTINSPLLHGWLCDKLGGADLSWILPIVVSAAVYTTLCGRQLRQEKPPAQRGSSQPEQTPSPTPTR